MTTWRGTQRAAAAYGARAAEYVEAVGTMAATAPQDRALVERWAAESEGPLLDLGCGPGQWTAHLAAQGHDVVGMDPAAEFLEIARREHPTVQFRDGGVEDLHPAERWGGVLAWYSLIHLDPADVPAALARLHACLAPGGRALIGFFDADDCARARAERAAPEAPRPLGPEPFPHAVAQAYRWPAAAMAALLRQTGLRIEHTAQRTDPGARPHAAIVAVREE